VSPHQTLSFRVAWSITQSSADAEDAVQEAFLKAWRNLGRFEIGMPFRPWLLTIVGNEARNHVRSRSRRIRRELGMAVPDLAPSDPAEDSVAADERRRLHAAITTLDDGARSVVICRYLLDLSELETAAILGTPPGTVKSRLDRAKRKLSKILTESGVPE
jgi:RNA polymerase sigma factor (sigma-70 family)